MFQYSTSQYQYQYQVKCVVQYPLLHYRSQQGARQERQHQAAMDICLPAIPIVVIMIRMRMLVMVIMIQMRVMRVLIMVMEEEKEYYEKIIRNVTNNGHLYSCKFLDDPPKSHNEDEEQYSDLLNGQ